MTLDCMNCGCGPHRNKLCHACKKCSQYVRMDLQMAYALTNINNLLVNEIQTTQYLLATIVDYLGEVHPDVKARIEAKRAEMYEQAKKEMEAKNGNPPAAESPSGIPDGSSANRGAGEVAVVSEFRPRVVEPTEA
jgi:hypothetical protein